jgi:predicted AAA+ superfamily ATPase
MALIQRAALQTLRELAQQFRCVAVTGPRQSGKTTLLKQAFPAKVYVSLEDPDVFEEAQADTKRFLQKFKQGAIIDEAQKLPQLFNYLQGVLDANPSKKGLFILSGSNNFLLQQSISQSLAGRVAYLQLLPLSYSELSTKAAIAQQNKFEVMQRGAYPEIVVQKIEQKLWYENYLNTYIEKDVRLIRNINNADAFKRFIAYCAGLAGQQLQINKMASDLSIDVRTVNEWLSVLQASYIIYLVQPYFNNYLKRLTKAPKLYFCDTGLLCHLLKIYSASKLSSHESKGAIFENWVITELRKNQFNQGMLADQYYFRDSAGNGVDLIQSLHEEWTPIEIKLNAKYDAGMTKGLQWYRKLSRINNGMLIYGGDASLEITEDMFANSWRDVADIG